MLGLLTPKKSQGEQNMNAHTVLDFWFNKTDKKNWFSKDEQFDQYLRDHFGELHNAASMGELYSWRV
ncbi:MAG: hypothetical protein ACI9FB_003803, partial [Candidatus Azotimanducaceae bacterium]